MAGIAAGGWSGLVVIFTLMTSFPGVVQQDHIETYTQGRVGIMLQRIGPAGARPCPCAVIGNYVGLLGNSYTFHTFHLFSFQAWQVTWGSFIGRSG